jgi:hypothetical protein
LLLSPVTLGAMLVAAAAALVYVLDQEFNSGRLTNPIIKAVDSVFGGILDWLMKFAGLTSDSPVTEHGPVKEIPYQPGMMPGLESLGVFHTDIIPIHLDQLPGETLNQYDDRKRKEKEDKDFNNEMRALTIAQSNYATDNPKNADAWAAFQKENAGNPKALADKERWKRYLDNHRRMAELKGPEVPKMDKVGLGASSAMRNLGDFEMRSSAGVGLVLDLLTGKQDNDTAKRLLAEAEKTAAHTEEMAANLKPKRIGGRR